MPPPRCGMCAEDAVVAPDRDRGAPSGGAPGTGGSSPPRGGRAAPPGRRAHGSTRRSARRTGRVAEGLLRRREAAQRNEGREPVRFPFRGRHRHGCEAGSPRQRLLPWSCVPFRGSLGCPARPHGFCASPGPGPLSRTRPRPSGTRRRGREVNQRREPLVSFRSPSEYDRPELRSALQRRAPLQGPFPYSACGGGKRLPRVCLARVRCVFGVSHPLDALFLPRPFGRLSGRCAHGILPFEGFPFRGMVRASRPVLPAWCRLRRIRRACAGGASLTSRAFVSAEVRCRSVAEAAGTARASLGLLPLQGWISLHDGPARHGASSPGLERGRRRTACLARPFGVSIAEGLGALRRERRPSWGLAPHLGKPSVGAGQVDHDPRLQLSPLAQSRQRNSTGLRQLALRTGQPSRFRGGKRDGCRVA